MEKGTGPVALVGFFIALGCLAPVPLPVSGEEFGVSIQLSGGARLSMNPLAQFCLDKGDYLLGPASHWSLRVDQTVLEPGTNSYESAQVHPVRMGAGGARTVLLQGDCLIELAFQGEGGTGVLTATAVNTGNRTVKIDFRCRFDIRAMDLSIEGYGALQKETAVTPRGYFQTIGSRWGGPVFSVVAMNEPSLVAFISTPDHLQGLQWDFPVLPSLNLSQSPGILFYWEGRDIEPGKYSKVQLLVSAGLPESIAISEYRLDVNGITVAPVSDFERRQRAVTVSVANNGPDFSGDLEVLFSCAGEVTTTRTFPVRLPWNRTTGVDLLWTPALSGNYTVTAFLPFHNDGNPGDNFKKCKAEAEPNPYRFVLKFAGGDALFENKSFPGGKVKAQMFVYNTGAIRDSVRIRIDGLPDRWTALFSGNLIELEPSQMVYIWLTVLPAYNANDGSYAFSITATSVNSGEVHALMLIIEIGVPPPPVNDPNRPPPIPVTDPANGTVMPAVPLNPYPGYNDDGRPLYIDRTTLAYGVATAIGLFVAIILVTVAIYQVSEMTTLTALQRIIKKALYKLETGDEYRKTIFLTYSRMCRHLEKYGYTREEAVTPREFERALRVALPLDISSIKALTRLFEEARYSDHRMGDRSRRSAIRSLQLIENDMDKLTVFEEHVTPWDRLKKKFQRENN